MRTVELDDERVAALEAVAAVEHTTVGALLAAPVDDLLRDRWDRAREVIDELMPLVRAARALGLGSVDLDDLPAPELNPDPEPPATPTEDPPEEPTVDEEPCGIEGCDRTARTLRRGMCGMHYQRWQRGTLQVAADGTRSPKAPKKPKADPRPDVDPTTNGIRSCCQAHECGTPALPGGAKFCPDHSARVPRIAEALKPRLGKDAMGEAVARLIDGRAR